MSLFRIYSPFLPAGDQPKAITALIHGFRSMQKEQVLLGVTGSGKTFTMAHVIAALGLPTLIMAPNKTLAAQLYGEMKAFFPENAVEYFVSYYDFYQPEAYIAKTNTYIEKQAVINEQIDRMRHSATRALIERQDVIVIASVSCIYGLGSVDSYSTMTLSLKVGDKIGQKAILNTLVQLLYKRNDIAFSRGAFRVRGDSIYIFPAHYEDRAWRVVLFGDEIERITEIEALTGKHVTNLDCVKVYANNHYITPGNTINQAIVEIQKELENRVIELKAMEKLVEAQRLQERISFDIEMMQITGSCQGIENYSRYLSGRAPGEPPPTLFEYLQKDALLIVDESHVAVPQLGAMYVGDAARKSTLSEYGFRLPSCADNRPLKFQEWEQMRPKTLFVSATPGPYELNLVKGVISAEQVIRPTGLLDPICIIRPTETQIDDLIGECVIEAKKGNCILVTTLTKKTAETLAEYLYESGIKARYMHSDVETLERIEIIQDLRKKKFNVLIGINLLREGLDIPECSLVVILDADKEGFLRSKTSLIQTIGRCARHVEGRVILYADKITGSMAYAIEETERRRQKQEQYNIKNNISPKGIQKELRNVLPDNPSQLSRDTKPNKENVGLDKISDRERTSIIKKLTKQMLEAAKILDFEKAAEIRDKLNKLSGLA